MTEIAHLDQLTPEPFTRGELVVSYRVGVGDGVFPIVVMVDRLNGGVFSGTLIYSTSQPDIGRYDCRWVRCEFTRYTGKLFIKGDAHE